MEKAQGARAHLRKVVLRCSACNKTLAVAKVGRRGVAFDWSTGVRFDLPLDDDTGDGGSYYGGGDAVYCTRTTCGAGPRPFPFGELDELIKHAAKAGEKTLRVDLGTDG